MLRFLRLTLPMTVCGLVIVPTLHAAEVINTNLLANPGFETTTGWSVAEGNFARGQLGPSPYEGTYYYSPGTTAWCSIYQEFDLAARGYDPFRLAHGGYGVSFGGYQNSWDRWVLFVNVANDEGLIGLNEYTSDGTQHERTDLGWVAGNGASNGWEHSSRTTRLKDNTTKVRYTFWAERKYDSANNSAFLDGAYLKIIKYQCWTTGAVNPELEETSAWSGDCLVVGVDSDGDAGCLYIGDEGTVNVAGACVGSELYVNGEESVANVRGTWNCTGKMVVGKRTAGTVAIEAGGKVTAASSVLADWFRPGTVTIDGAGSEWEVTGAATIGYADDGLVTVKNGGTLTTDHTVLAQGDGSSGTVTVDGAGSTWTSGNTVVSYLSTGIVNVTDGGAWTATDTVIVGSNYNYGSGNVNVSGSDSIWTTEKPVYVSQYGQGNVTLADGATWAADGAVTVGYQYKAVGTVNIESGATWKTSGTVTLGDTHAVLNIDGADSRWVSSGETQISGSGKTDLTVTNGGKLTFTNHPLSFGSKGTLTLEDSTAEMLGGVTLRGTIDMSDSALVLDGACKIAAGGEISGSGTISTGTQGLGMDSTGCLSGSGSGEQLTLNGYLRGRNSVSNVVLNGDLSVGTEEGTTACLKVSEVTLSPNHTLTMEIGGATAGSEHDQLELNGPLSVAGDLDIVWLDGVSVYGDTRFVLFKFSGGTLEGTFDSVSLPDVPEDGMFWDTDELYTAGTITLGRTDLTLETTSPEVDVQKSITETGKTSFVMTVSGGTRPYIYAWEVDGVAVADVAGDTFTYRPGYAVVDHPAVSANPQITCTVTDSADPPASVSATWTGLTVTDVNQVTPKPTAISVWPSTPGTLEDVAASVTVAPDDPDGDPITGYGYVWTSGEKRVEAPTLPAASTVKGETWTVTVVPRTDPYGTGAVDGLSTQTQITVFNTPPEFSPGSPIYCQLGETVQIPLTAIDPDVDDGVDTLTWSCSVPTHGTVVLDQAGAFLSYTAAQGDSGTDGIYVGVSDGESSDSSQITVNRVDWWFALNLVAGQSTIQRVVLGTAGCAGEGMDDIDQEALSADVPIVSVAPDDVLLSGDILGDLAGRPWLLRIDAETGDALSWNSAAVPPVGLVLRETDTTGMPVDGASVTDMALVDSYAIAEAGTKHFIVSTVRTFDLPLHVGWNMISTPIAPLDGRVTALFQGTRGAVVRKPLWVWDATSQSYRSAAALTARQGFWGYVESTDTPVTVKGTPVLPVETLLQKGWNLIGVTADTALPISDAIDGVCWGWNGQNYNSPERFSCGCAYWVFASGETTIPQ